jgi:RND family efflux transporter MFP subunit
MSNPTTTPPPEKKKESQSHLPSIHMGKWIWIAAVIFFLVVVWLIWRHISSQRELDESAKAASQVTVEFVKAKKDNKPHALTLPGNIQAFVEATLYARTNGYLKAWYVDIGSPVKEGQLLAEIEAPDVDAQSRQASASTAQSLANLDIARLNFERSKDLLQKKVISQQEFDQRRTDQDSQQAAVKASEANVENLQTQQGFQKIIAPFSGTLTRRFVDVGALVSAGSGNAGTMLFSIAQTDPLRIYTFVPQSNAPSIIVGMKAKVLVEEYPGREFEGTVTRTAGAIDPASRTLLTEVDIPNKDGTLYAGMYVQIKFILEDKEPPIVIPANAFMFRTDGAQVAVVTKDNKIHWQNVKVRRDFGTTIELASGLDPDTSIVINPSDDLREGMEVQAKLHQDKPAPGASAAPSASPSPAKDQSGK